MATLKLNPKNAVTDRSRSPARGAGMGVRRRPTLAEAQAERARRDAQPPFDATRRGPPPGADGTPQRSARSGHSGENRDPRRANQHADQHNPRRDAPRGQPPRNARNDGDNRNDRDQRNHGEPNRGPGGASTWSQGRPAEFAPRARPARGPEQTQHAPRYEPQPRAKHGEPRGARPDTRPDARANPRTAARGDRNDAPRAQPRFENQPGDARNQPPERWQARPQMRSDARSDVRSDARSDIGTNWRADSRTDSRTDRRPDQRTGSPRNEQRSPAPDPRRGGAQPIARSGRGPRSDGPPDRNQRTQAYQGTRDDQRGQPIDPRFDPRDNHGNSPRDDQRHHQRAETTPERPPQRQHDRGRDSPPVYAYAPDSAIQRGPKRVFNSQPRDVEPYAAPRHDDRDPREAPRALRSAPDRGPFHDAAGADGSMRLSKRMSELGLSSRREADEWIDKGWVRVDGNVVSELGSRVMPDQRITIDARAKFMQAQKVTVLINKPIGYVSGQAEDGYEPAVVLVKPDTQWPGDQSGTRFLRDHLRSLVPAGRLDIDSIGLLVLTQDGRIAKQLIGEDSAIEKEYLVRVTLASTDPLSSGPPSRGLSATDLQRLRHGLELDGEALQPAVVEWQNDDQLRFVLQEGKKRQIRRMCEAVGLKVLGLKRVRIGSVMLGDLPVGQWRYLRGDEVFG